MRVNPTVVSVPPEAFTMSLTQAAMMDEKV